MAQQFDVIVVGAGPGGYVAAIRCAQLGFKTACVEKRVELGGTCLNVGCIPSKALLHSSELYAQIKKGIKNHGIDVAGVQLDFKQMMARKTQIISSFNQGIAALFQKNKITRLSGAASFVNPTTLRVSTGEEVSARQIILATGSEPIPLPFLPFDEKRVLSSTGALSLQQIPSKMVIVGAGIIGVELGSVYARLGTQVVFVEFLEQICGTLDESLSKELLRQLEAQGMQFHLRSKVVAARVSETQVTLDVVKQDGSSNTLTADLALVSIGRKPYTQGLNLEGAGVTLSDKGFVKIDGLFRTSQPHIFAIGDSVDGPMLAHKASEEGVAVAEILAGHSPQIDYAAIPNVVYTHPEVASVGLTEAEAVRAGLSIKTGTFAFKANSRARCTGEEEGFVKMIAMQGNGKIVGIHIIGAHASELIAEGALALQKRATWEEIAATPHAHPTLSEALKEAALAVDGRAIHK